MASSPDPLAGLRSQGWLVRAADATRGWSLAAASGRLAEIHGAHASAALTFAFGLVLEAQQAGAQVGWMTGVESAFFPPDAAESGVDLASLLVVRVPRAAAAAWAADQLARTGAFRLLVIDLVSLPAERVPTALLARLLGLAQKHALAIVFISGGAHEAEALGSLVSLRVEAARGRSTGEGFLCRLRIVKDKRGAPGAVREEVCDGPAGLC